MGIIRYREHRSTADTCTVAVRRERCDLSGDVALNHSGGSYYSIAV